MKTNMAVFVDVERGYRVNGTKIKYEYQTFTYRSDEKLDFDHGFIVEHDNGYVEYLPDSNIVKIEPAPEALGNNEIVITYCVSGSMRILGVTKEMADKIKVKEVENGIKSWTKSKI